MENKKTVLILGGSGFIGTNIILNFLKKKDEYYIVATKHKTELRVKSKEIIEYKVDLTDRREVNNMFNVVSPDVVIHAAAVTTGSKDVIERPYLHVTDNIIMNSLVFEMSHIYKVKHTIFFSCTVMYQPKDFAQKESDWKIEDPIYSSYFGVGSMKVFSERMCEFYSRLGNTKFTAIRHSNVFGPYDKFDLDKCHVLPAMINKVTNAKDKLEVWGDGQARRDVIFIDDLVQFVDLCIQNQKNPYELFNCGLGHAYSIREIISEIQKALNKNDLELVYDLSKPNIPTTVILDCSKALNLLNWKPITLFASGIQKTIEYYKNNYGH